MTEREAKKDEAPSIDIGEEVVPAAMVDGGALFQTPCFETARLAGLNLLPHLLLRHNGVSSDATMSNQSA